MIKVVSWRRLKNIILNNENELKCNRFMSLKLTFIYRNVRYANFFPYQWTFVLNMLWCGGDTNFLVPKSNINRSVFFVIFQKYLRALCVNICLLIWKVILLTNSMEGYQAIYTDFTKAFDLLNFKIVIYKINNL